MAFPRGNVSFLLLLTLTILFVSSQAASLEKAISGRGGYVLVPFRRSAAEGPVALSGNSINNSSFVLASERTERRDPLNDFKDYTGGWNISNRHYWASVGFTAAPLFGIALTWFVVFGLVLIISGFCYCCCHRPIHPYSYSAYVVSLTLLILFTLAAIIGCVLLYYGQQKFHNSSSDTLDYVVSQANFTVENLREFSGNLSAAKRIKVTNLLIPGDIQNRIDDIVNKVNTSANDLDRRASKNSKNIRDVLNTVRLILIIVAAVMLLLAFLGFILSILGLQFLVYILVLIGWFLVAAMFILSGVFLLMHNAVGDTCVAMDEWVSHPKEHTALDDILPCVNAATANQSLYSSRQVTFKLADMVNNVINGVSNPTNPSISFNQSGPLMPTLCNPFNQDLSNRSCAAGEVVLTNASQVWRKYECNVTIVNGAEICKTVGRVTPTLYDQMNSAVSVAYALYHYSPFLVQLEDCSFAREAFRSVSHENCPSLRKYTNWVFIGLTLVSAAVMLSIIFWVIYARERRHRMYNKQQIFYEGRDPVAGKP
ncbi:uncharacterized protein LOC110098069 [Dendrobium catenatum]|uniref:Transmembrane protein n=1 Tax=Dendrobium catenatum TaxID=906689 RepID=A0A2I0W2T1_9ASPA|nr:uncharacterized protein LOC110098069 [Dendrobium catenatum]PKU69966.1 hypothetical protein MA16_Dca014925 [Dendrobium catenatum]